ncbi:MAG: DUF2085 domain-containing protein [Pyrinomonadaceae bacterium]
MSLVVLIAETLYRAAMAAGSVWCHQRPERSPQLFGAQGPLCWRCSGILAGTLILLVFLFCARRTVASLQLSLALAVLLPLDVFVYALGYHEGENLRRLLTGLLWGIFATNVFLLLAALANRPGVTSNE